MRRIVDERAREQRLQICVTARQPRADIGERRRQADAVAAAAQQSCAGLCRGKSISDGAEVLGRAALQGQPRQRARQVGRVPERAPDILAQRLALVQKADRIEPVTDSIGIAQGAGEPGRQLACAGPGDGAVDGGEQAR